MFKNVLNVLAMKVFAEGASSNVRVRRDRGFEGNRGGFGNAPDVRRRIRRGTRQGTGSATPRGVRGAARTSTVTRYGPMM